jgi:hypothetical protein
VHPIGVQLASRVNSCLCTSAGYGCVRTPDSGGCCLTCCCMLSSHWYGQAICNSTISHTAPIPGMLMGLRLEWTHAYHQCWRYSSGACC